ncbi:probable serine/threonine-protein kinase DDB_G0267686 [Musca vetustissima]|uniref:probable serine/threonine-protein kinase DDB_G0267686 n=1 Tax=Musca vetustissima TaxID=27455 RepID=UPI002AB6E26D|nr:probable serine/threonine-protein kinase DDB_G0267686 [Musca vetustissima]
MNNKLTKSKENNENLCPTTRKRLPSKSATQTPTWKLAKLESTSSPSALTNDYLEEMGIGMLDSEESSSSAASAIALAVASADENSNEATPNLDAPKFCHQQRQIYLNMDTSLLDTTNDNASNHSFLDPNDTSTSIQSGKSIHGGQSLKPHPLSINNNSNSSSSFDIYTDEQGQQTIQKTTNKINDKFPMPNNTAPLVTTHQQKKIAILGMGAGNVVSGSIASGNSNSPSSAGKNTRSPLATVACNSFLRNAQLQQQLLLQQQQQQQLQLQQNTFNNSIQQRSHSPSMMPSTSQQAAILKHQQQQQLQKQYLQQQHQQQQQQQLQHTAHIVAQTPRFAPSDTFFLFRNQTMRERNPDGKDHFNTLSDEIILQIFKWLPKKTLLRCGYVCRRFNRCASDESLWTRLDLGGRSIKAGAMENILKRGVVILRLAQAELNHPVFEPRFLEAEPNFESKLQYLDLSMITITKPSLKMLLTRCRQLKKLSLEHVALNDEICNEIAKNTGLEALNLAMCSGLEAWSVRKIMESLKQLNSLNISWTNLSVDAVTSLVTNVTPNLMRLNVAGCRKTMFDSHLASLAKRCTQLLELDLSDCTGLTGNAISIICKFKMLEYLSLSRCYLIPASAYIELRNMPTLTYLDIFGMLTDSALEMLEHTFSKIGINKFIHSSVARPTVGTRRTSIWGLRTRD